MLIGELFHRLRGESLVLTTGGRDFAANVSIRFYTPEEFFLDASPEQVIRQFDPKAYLDVDPDAPGE